MALPLATASLVPSGDTSLAEALERFGAGKAIPGSGSANALVGAIAAALTSSVAAKTYEHRDSPRYRPVSDAARDIVSRGRKWSRELLDLMEQDATAFGEVIAIRLRAKNLIEQYARDQALRKEIGATKPATEIPLRVAVITLDVAERAIVMVGRGFVAARGESYSALGAALAAADGSISVARMNLKTVRTKVNKLYDPGYERPWIRRITKSLDQLAVRWISLHAREQELRNLYDAAPTASTVKRLRNPRRSA